MSKRDPRFVNLISGLPVGRLINRCLEYHDRIEELEAENARYETAIEKVSGLVKRLEAKLARECVWKPNDGWEEQYWSSSCGEDWSFIDGDPEENRVNFCQGCGGKVVIALNQQEESS